MRKTFCSLVLIGFALAHCNSPRPVTANPDNHTTTSGTLGSGKMTNTLPEKTDTSAIKSDSIPKRQ